MIPEHQTPFVVGSSVLPDRDGREQLIVVLKASFDVEPDGSLVASAEQDPVRSHDELRGKPERGCIAWEADLCPPKPGGTDVFLVGDAVARTPGTRQQDVRLRLGSIDKRAVVFGPRTWGDGALGATPSAPEPFERVPLTWENAFGGEDMSASAEGDWEREARNPAGRGFRAHKSRAEWRATALPQIEHPESLVRSPGDRPPPVGFGPIGRHWHPRVTHAGTYDPAWQKERAPLLPADFDERFHHAAPPDQIIAGYVQGGEAVEIVGCTPEGLLRFALPSLRPRLYLALRLRDETHELRCESVTIEASRRRAILTYKTAVPLHGEVMAVREIAVGLPEDEP